MKYKMDKEEIERIFGYKPLMKTNKYLKGKDYKKLLDKNVSSSSKIEIDAMQIAKDQDLHKGEDYNGGDYRYERRK